jgi:hypothetical protein
MKFKVGDLIRYKSRAPAWVRLRRQTIGLVIRPPPIRSRYIRVLWQDGVSGLVHSDYCALAFNPQRTKEYNAN